MKTKIFSKILGSITLLLIILTSCKVEPKDINYGNDHCHFCDMTVVDKTHAAQYVTKKGKAYMFDAIECMVNDLNKNNNEDTMAFLLVADYANPGNLVDAKTATFLISEKIKSPMGENLSAFSSKEIAEKVLKENGGKLYTWSTLKEKFSN
jgi:copper chaperone NosL